jgi:DNA-binding HxlR family transcriptional regulator
MNSRVKELREARLVELTSGGYALTAEGLELMRHLKPLHRWAEGWAAHTRDGADPV